MAMNLTYDRTIVYHCYILFEKTNHFSMLVKASLFMNMKRPGGSLGGINGGHPAEARQVAGFHHLISPPTLLLETW